MSDGPLPVGGIVEFDPDRGAGAGRPREYAIENARSRGRSSDRSRSGPAPTRSPAVGQRVRRGRWRTGSRTPGRSSSRCGTVRERDPPAGPAPHHSSEVRRSAKSPADPQAPALVGDPDRLAAVADRATRPVARPPSCARSTWRAIASSMSGEGDDLGPGVPRVRQVRLHRVGLREVAVDLLEHGCLAVDGRPAPADVGPHERPARG